METTDDDLFPPIRPPSSEVGVVSQSNDNPKVEDDADADAATEDGSEEADESDEVWSSFPYKKYVASLNDAGHRVYHGARKPQP